MPLLTTAFNLTANTTGNVYLSDLSNVRLGASSAGATNTFSLLEDTSNATGVIIIAGAVNAGTLLAKVVPSFCCAQLMQAA